ncbi:rRNA maturation RNase YbeY [Candidatus Azambacteria bacterium]|nr:rRNA maturation RNase YbeY [Candidatus Azambacteria bacterium]
MIISPRVFRIAARSLKLPPRSRVSLHAVGEREMRMLNFRARRDGRVTDVLSFPAGPRFPGEDPRWLGEIVICLPRARRQAKAAGISLLQEEARLFVHGLLHLVGYDHEKSEREARRHFQMEEKIFAKLHVKKGKE